MLGPKLNYIRDLIVDLDGPERMVLDDNTGRLYVADNNYEIRRRTTGQVKVFHL
jgi:myo-inositol-hexaphosphate 3-phosphohydrolase